MAQEISLHKTLNHAYIVQLYSFFEDKVDFKYFFVIQKIDFLLFKLYHTKQEAKNVLLQGFA